MRWRNLAQNLYKSPISQSIPSIWASGNPLDEFDIFVTIAPKYNSGWIFCDFTDSSKRDLIYFHSRTWNNLKYYRKNRDLLGNWAYAVVHDQGTYIQENDVSEWLNFISYNTDDFGYLEYPYTTALSVRVYGWSIQYGWTTSAIWDTTITLPISSTKEIIFDFADSTFKAVDTAALSAMAFYHCATVITGPSTITSVVDKRILQLPIRLSATFFEAVSWFISIKDWSIGTTQITNAAITQAKLAANSVWSNEIQDNAVWTTEIVNDAVTSAKIAQNPLLRWFVEMITSATPGNPTAWNIRLYVKNVAWVDTLWMIRSDGSESQILPQNMTPISATKVWPITWNPSWTTLTVTDPLSTNNSVVMSVAMDTWTPVGTYFDANPWSWSIVFSSFDMSWVPQTESWITFYYTIVY